MRSALGAFAVKAYVYADQTSGLAGLLSGSSLTDGAAQRAGYQTVALGANIDMTDEVKAVIEDTAARAGRARRPQAEGGAARRQLRRRQEAGRAGARPAAAAQVKVKGELATLVAQEQPAPGRRGRRRRPGRRRRRRRAAAAGAARDGQAGAGAGRAPAAPTGGQPRPGSAQKLVSEAGRRRRRQIDIPATSPGAATAVRAALSQVGKGYRFAAAGPDAYDCSGLTMWAWAQAGVSLPHYSKAQYAVAAARAAERPAAGRPRSSSTATISHVGIYIGGGQMVDAANPALGVRVTGIGGNVGAARP